MKRLVTVSAVVLVVVAAGCFLGSTNAYKAPVLNCSVCNGRHVQLDKYLWIRTDGVDPRILYCESGHQWRDDTGQQIRLINDG